MGAQHHVPTPPQFVCDSPFRGSHLVPGRNVIVEGGNLAFGWYNLWLDALPHEGPRGGLVVWAAAACLIPVGDAGDAAVE